MAIASKISDFAELLANRIAEQTAEAVEPGQGRALAMELLELELALADNRTADLALVERLKRLENRTVFAVDSTIGMMVEAQELELGLAVALVPAHCLMDSAVADTARMDKALELERCSMD